MFNAQYTHNTMCSISIFTPSQVSLHHHLSPFTIFYLPPSPFPSGNHHTVVCVLGAFLFLWVFLLLLLNPSTFLISRTIPNTGVILTPVLQIPPHGSRPIAKAARQSEPQASLQVDTAPTQVLWLLCFSLISPGRSPASTPGPVLLAMGMPC